MAYWQGGRDELKHAGRPSTRTYLGWLGVPRALTMTLLIDNDTQERVLEMAEAVEAMDDAFRQFGTHDAAFLPRTDLLSFPTVEEAGEMDKYWFAVLQGAIRDPPRVALRFRSDVHWFETDEAGNTTTKKYSTEPGLFMGFVLLFDSSNGELIGMLNDGVIQHYRVGALAGVAADQLAREDAASVGFIGSGEMARMYAEAFSVVRDIEEIAVFSRSPENRQSFAADVGDRLGVDGTPCETAAEAIEGVDIVASCTSSITPVIDTTLLEPGQFYVNVNEHELDPATADNVDRIVTTTRRPYIFNRDLVLGSDEEYEAYLDEWENGPFPVYSPIDFTEIREVLVGDAPGRADDDEIVFYDNRSCGIQFAALGQLIHRRAEEAGLGTEVPLSWFLQDIVS